jgi:hypothetical protein
MKRLAFACAGLISVAASAAQAAECEDVMRVRMEILNAERPVLSISVAAARARAIRVAYQACRAANMKTARGYFDELSEQAS